VSLEMIGPERAGTRLL